MPNIRSMIDAGTSLPFWKTMGEAISPLALWDKVQRGKLADFYRNNGLQATAKEMFSGYFGGKSVPFGSDMASTGWNASQVARARKLGLGIGGGLLAANQIIPNAFVTSAANLAAGGALHGTIARALWNKNKLFGGGYGAWSGLNLLSSGDQIGPF